MAGEIREKLESSSYPTEINEENFQIQKEIKRSRDQFIDKCYKYSLVRYLNYVQHIINGTIG